MNSHLFVPCHNLPGFFLLFCDRLCLQHLTVSLLRGVFEVTHTKKDQALNVVHSLSLLNYYILIHDKNYNLSTPYITLYSLGALYYAVMFVLCFWEGFFSWPVSQRKHIRGVLSKALLVFPSSSACWECFSLAGGLTGAPQVPEVNDSGAEILAIGPLAIDLHQWYITAKCSRVAGVPNRGTVKTFITGWHYYFF